MATALDSCSCKCNPCVCLPPAGSEVGCLPLACVPRPCFFDGQLIGAEDLNASVSYARNQDTLMGRFLAGFGVMGGLKVDAADPTRRNSLATGALASLSNSPQVIAGTKVIVSPGVAMDSLGRKLTLCQSTVLDLQQLAQQAAQGELKSGNCETLLGDQCTAPSGVITVTEFYLVAELNEVANRPAPQFSGGGPCDPAPTCSPSRKEENVRFSLVGPLPVEYRYTGCVDPTGFTFPTANPCIETDPTERTRITLALIDRVQNDLAQLCCGRPAVVLARVLLTRDPGSLKNGLPSVSLYTLLDDGYPYRRPIPMSGLVTDLVPKLACSTAVTSQNIVFNVKDYGATGNGTTDDTSAIQATHDAAQAALGGIVFFPVGNYVITRALTWSADVPIWGVPGRSTIVMAASGTGFYINVTSSTGATGTITEIANMAFTAGVSTSAVMVGVTHGATRTTLFRNCTFGGHPNCVGPAIYVSSENSDIRVADCNFRIHLNGEVIYHNSGHCPPLSLENCRVIMPPVFNDEFAHWDSDLFVTGCLFDFTALTSGSARCLALRAGGRGTIVGNTFRFSSVSAYALSWEPGAYISESGNTFTGLTATSAYSPAGNTLAVGSTLSMPGAIDKPMGSTGVLPDGFHTISIRGQAGAPNITFPAMMFRGQELQLTLHNEGGMLWGAGSVHTTGAVEPLAGFPAIATGQTIGLRYVVAAHEGSVVGNKWVLASAPSNVY